MPWARLEDQRWRNRKMRRLSWGAIGLDDVAISYCCDNLTNGVLTREDIEDIAAMHGAKGAEIMALVDELVTHERWVRTGENWRVHDFLEYNPSAKQVKEDRKASAKRQADARTRRRNAQQGVTASSVTDVSRRDSRVTHGEVTRESQHPVPTRPDPSRPVPEEEEEKGSQRAPETAPASAPRGSPDPDPGGATKPGPEHRRPPDPEPDPEWQAEVDQLRAALRRRDKRKAQDVDNGELRLALTRRGEYAGIPRDAIRPAITRGLRHLLAALDSPEGVARWGRYFRVVALAESQNTAADSVEEQAEQHREDLDAAAVALLGSAGRRRPT